MWVCGFWNASAYFFLYTNKLLLNHFVLRKTILQYFTHAFICFDASWSVKTGEKIKVLRSSNFHVTTRILFLWMNQGFVSMCKHWRINHIKTTAQNGFMSSFWMVRQSLQITEIHNLNNSFLIVPINFVAKMVRMFTTILQIFRAC